MALLKQTPTGGLKGGSTAPATLTDQAVFKTFRLKQIEHFVDILLSLTLQSSTILMTFVLIRSPHVSILSLMASWSG